jgi:hypothetical protein
VISRTTPYLACRFPNGALAFSRHFHDTEENWPGGFARNQKQDAELMKRYPPPSEAIDLKDLRVHGHYVTYSGEQAMVFRTDVHGALIAFAGASCDRIKVDGHETVFADQKLGGVAWAPVQQERRVPDGALLQIMVYGTGTLHIPIGDLAPGLALVAEGPTPGSRGETIPCHVEGRAIADLSNGGLQVSPSDPGPDHFQRLVFTVAAGQSGRWLYAVPAAK